MENVSRKMLVSKFIHSRTQIDHNTSSQFANPPPPPRFVGTIYFIRPQSHVLIFYLVTCYITIHNLLFVTKGKKTMGRGRIDTFSVVARISNYTPKLKIELLVLLFVLHFIMAMLRYRHRSFFSIISSLWS